MLYIFRYFKEIQISIFVIKTMFEIFFLIASCCDKVCEDLSYLVSPIPVLLNQSSPVGSARVVRTPEPEHVGPAASETPDPAREFRI